MRKNLLVFVFCLIFIFTQVIQVYCISQISPNSPYITLDLDKTNANVGDIITASVRISSILNFTDYSITIKYDPKVLQAVNPHTGAPYNNSTNPIPGDIWLNQSLRNIVVANHDIEKGILSFAVTYKVAMFFLAYEASGVTDILGFKVISPDTLSTSIRFEDKSETLHMPSSISGTYITSSYTKVLTEKDYSVVQPKDIGINQKWPQPTASRSYTLSGFVNPDVDTSVSNSPEIRSGFKAEIMELNTSALTDSRGYFDFRDIPYNPDGYTLIICRENYLTRTIKNVRITQDTTVSTFESPLVIWAGDMGITGTQDDAINISDILEIAKYFNTCDPEANYKNSYDFNHDYAINITDILTVVKHFNSSTADNSQL